jgi:LuxR family transcriptional regulator of spore coat protein
MPREAPVINTDRLVERNMDCMVNGAFSLAELGQKVEDLGAFERGALEVFGTAISFDVAFWVRNLRFGPGTRGFDSVVLAACEPQLGHFRRELTPVFDAARRGIGVAVDAEVMGAQLRRTRSYRQMMSPVRGRQTLIAQIAPRSGEAVLIALGRTGRTPFHSRERQALARWAPVLGLCESALQRSACRAGAALTAREQEVAEHLQRGLTSREIATVCGTSEHTVKNQLRSVYRKLGATTRAEAVAICLGH